MKDDAERFIAQMLPVIRRMFYKGKTAKEFFQEESLLIKVITYPAFWIKRLAGDRAWLPVDSYRRIVLLVLTTAKQSGEKPRRISAYLDKCMTSHMQHHGEDYYNEAKVRRNGRESAMIPQSMAKLIPGVVDALPVRGERPDDLLTDILAEAHKVAKSRGGRRRIQKGSNDGFAGDLFGGFRAPSSGLQRPGKVSHSIAKSPDSVGSLSQATGAEDPPSRRDSSG